MTRCNKHAYNLIHFPACPLEPRVLNAPILQPERETCDYPIQSLQWRSLLVSFINSRTTGIIALSLFRPATNGAHGTSLLGRHPGFTLTPSDNEFATHPTPTNHSLLASLLRSPSASAHLASVLLLLMLGETEPPTCSCAGMFS